MDVEQSLRLAAAAVEDLRSRGGMEKAEAIETLLRSLRATFPTVRDLLARSETGELVAVSGRQIRDWVAQEGVESFTIGGGFRLPKEVVAAYVERAGDSLDFDPLTDEEVAALVDEERHR